MSEENRIKQTPGSKELTHPVMDTPVIGEDNNNVYNTSKILPIKDSTST